MSKKIYVPLVNIRCELCGMFGRMLDLCHESEYVYGDECYGGYWDDYGYDMTEEEILWLQSNGEWPQGNVPFHDRSRKRTHREIRDEFFGMGSKRHRRFRKGRNVRSRDVDLDEPFSGEEECYYEYDHDKDEFTPVRQYDDDGNLDDDGVFGGKEIYFYYDYHDKEHRETFHTLEGFEEYCEDMGYDVSDTVMNRIVFNRVSHVCLNPVALEYGHSELIAEDSYGTLFYEACESDELGY